MTAVVGDAAPAGAPAPPAVGVRLRGTARSLVALARAGADTTGVYTCQLAVLAAALGVTAGAVTKILQRLAAAGLELRIAYGTARDGRPIYATPGQPYRLRRPPAAAMGDTPDTQPRADTRADTRPRADSDPTAGDSRVDAARADNPPPRPDNPPAGYPQTAGQTRVDSCPTCGQRVDSLPPSKPGFRRSDEGGQLSSLVQGESKLSPPRTPARALPGAGPGVPGRGTRRTFADGAAMDWDPRGNHGRGAAYYRCHQHLALTVADGPGPACPRCAAVRMAHNRRRVPAQPPPGQRPLVAALDGGRAHHGQATPTGPAVQACPLCDHRGRLPTGRWCHHDPDATARNDAARATARAAARRRRTRTG